MCIRDSSSATSNVPHLSVPSGYRFILYLFGEAVVIQSAKMFPPIQPILENPVEYTHNIQFLPYICVSPMIMESTPCPVSYTHLDVYKRQVYMSVFLLLKLFLAVFISFIVCLRHFSIGSLFNLSLIHI